MENMPMKDMFDLKAEIIESFPGIDYNNLSYTNQHSQARKETACYV